MVQNGEGKCPRKTLSNIEEKTISVYESTTEVKHTKPNIFLTHICSKVLKLVLFFFLLVTTHRRNVKPLR